MRKLNSPDKFAQALDTVLVAIPLMIVGTCVAVYNIVRPKKKTFITMHGTNGGMYRKEEDEKQ